MKLNKQQPKILLRICQFIGRSIQSLDVLGHDWQLVSDQSRTYKTLSGAVLTLFLFIWTGFLAYTSAMRYFDTTSPHVNISTKIEEFFPKRHFYEEVYPLAISIYNGDNNHVLAEDVFKYVTPHLEASEIDMSDLENGVAGFDIPKFYTFKPCKDVVDKTLTNDFLVNNPNQQEKEFFEKYMICPDIDDPTELYALSNSVAPPYRKVDLKIYPCTLATTADCKQTLAEISDIKVKLATTSKNFIPENKLTDVIQTSITYDDIRINPSKETIKKAFMMGNELFNDDTELSP